jgi:Flp pilus assembly pilin Flp
MHTFVFAVSQGTVRLYTVVTERVAKIQNLQEHKNMTFLRNLWNEEQGQDLIEYTLLMAFVALASAALFIGAGGSIKGIWVTTNSQLAAANTASS